MSVTCPNCAGVGVIHGTFLAAGKTWKCDRCNGEGAVLLLAPAIYLGTCPRCDWRTRALLASEVDRTYALYGAHGARAEGCPTHHLARWRAVVQVRGKATSCGARCRNAKGPNCDCPCEAANHGAGYYGAMA